MARLRKHPLTPWGKEVQKRIIDMELSAAEVVRILRARGIPITLASFSAMLSGRHGMRSPDTIAAIDELLSVPQDVAGRPA